MEVLPFHMLCILQTVPTFFTFHLLAFQQVTFCLNVFTLTEKRVQSYVIRPYSSTNSILLMFHVFVHFVFSQLVCVVARAMQYPFISSPHMFQCYLHILILSGHVNCHLISDPDLSLNVLSPHYYGE